MGHAEVYLDRILILRRDWDLIYPDPLVNFCPGWEPSLQEAAYWVKPEVLLELSNWLDRAESPVDVIMNHFSVLMRKEANFILTKLDLSNLLRKTEDFDPDLATNILSNRILGAASPQFTFLDKKN